MASGPRYRVKLRRRREGKTNFYKRRDMLKSGKMRAVIRRSNKNIQVQFVAANADGDKTLAGASSLKLKDFGWKITGGNIPAAYLTGYLAGKMAIKAGIEEAIADLGVQTTARGGRIYAALKGIVDAGVSMPVNEEVFPEEDIIKGAHIAKASDDVQAKFALYKKAKLKVDGVAKLVDKTTSAIDKKF